MKQPVLHVEQLIKRFETKNWWGKSAQTFTAVNNISFELNESEVLGFLGPNGSGKTTTIQMLLGVMTPTSGNINYFGKDFLKHRSEILQHVTFASAYSKLIGKLTVMENMEFAGRLYGMMMSDCRQRSEFLLRYLGMWERRNQLVNELSAGQMTRAMLAQAFLPRPRIVLLDEPTASLDPDVAHAVREFIVQQRRETNIAALFTSHNMEEVAGICDRVLVLRGGSIIADDTPENLARSVTRTRISLLVSPACVQQALAYIAENQHIHAVVGQMLHVTIDEHEIAQFLQGLARQSIEYTSISIEKPRLEDYFLQIARRSYL